MKRLDALPSALRSSQVEDQGLVTELSAVPAYNPTMDSWIPHLHLGCERRDYLALNCAFS
jgi:hypothetical protein